MSPAAPRTMAPEQNPVEVKVAQAGEKSTENTSAAALWVVMARAYHSMAAFVEHSIAALGIGLSDFMILEALLHKGPMTMSALCDAALLANASMTSAIDRLEEKHFVERIADKIDRRVRLVQLTAEGRTLIKRLYTQHERDIEEVMNGISSAERTETRHVLKTIGLAAQERTSVSSERTHERAKKPVG